MTDQTDLLARILDYANRANPYPLYAELRKTPVLRLFRIQSASAPQCSRERMR